MTAGLSIAAKRHDMVTALQRGLVSTCGNTAPGTVVLGVSGGGDSTALLLAAGLLAGRDGFDLSPRVVHVHHHLRAEADEDAAHVEVLCGELNVPCEVIDVHPRNTGADARTARYEALMDAARRHESNWVATAHHAEDQLETIIAALGRGAGPEGLAGIAPSRPLGDGVSLVRPLLHVTRGQLRSMCESARVAWREDPTNEDPATLRGRLRMDVLPVLEELWPGVARRTAVNAHLVRAASMALAREVQSSFGDDQDCTWSRSDLREVDEPIRVAGLRRALLASGALGPDGICATTLRDAATAIGDGGEHERCFEFTGGAAIIVDANRVRLEQSDG